MTEKENKVDTINTLCKKYFTPELCDEEVIESKDTLKKNIMAQLYKFGVWCFNERIKRLSMDEKRTSPFIHRPDLKDDSIIEAIEKVFKKGEAKDIHSSYSSFFKKVLFDKFNKMQLLRDENHTSLDEPLNTTDFSSKSEGTLYDFIEDKKYLSVDKKNESSYSVFDILKIVENAYRNKERKKHKDWLSPLLTLELYEGLKSVCNCYGEEKLRKFTFADPNIYNLETKPTRKSLAESLKVDAGYLKTEKDKFFLPIKEQIEKILAEINEC